MTEFLGTYQFWMFCAGCFFLALMDIFNFLIGPGSSFWHMKPGNDDNDAWHWSKRAAIACFATAILFDFTLVFYAIAAYLIQKIVFDLIGKAFWGDKSGKV